MIKLNFFRPNHSSHAQTLLISFAACLLLTACAAQPSIEMTVTSLVQPSPTKTTSPTPTLLPPSATIPIPTETPTATATARAEPLECREPPEDYELVNLNGYLLNQRTLSMLEYAQSLYGGEIDLTGDAITQGSFHDNGAASFGTHLGGGAVDLSVMRPNTYTVLYEDIPAILSALRLAGFAAWLREPDEVYPGSAIHIHAIAIGDRDLSEAAQEQLTGEAGYFRGYSGLPPVDGTPTPDRYGGPVICEWMRAAGYEDLRPTPIHPDQDLPKKCLYCDRE